MSTTHRTTQALRALRDFESTEQGAFGCRLASVSVPVPRDDKRLIVPVRWTLGADVVRRPWFGDPFIERLLTAPENVNLERLNNEAPFLDSHRSYGLESVLGKVVLNSARMEGGAGLADAEFDPEDARSVEIYGKIVRGFLPKVSVGYSIDEYEILRGANKGDMDTLVATRWTPAEISAVPIAADDGAGFRFHVAGINPDDRDSHKRFFFQGARNMRNGIGAGGVTRMFAAPADAGTATPAPTEARTAPATPAPVPSPAPAAPVDMEAVKAAERALERARVATIRKDAKRLGLPETFVERMIGEDKPVDVARSMMIDEAHRIEAGTPTSGARGDISVGAEEGEKVARAWTHALMVKGDPDRNKHDEGSRNWGGSSLLDFAREALERSGRNTRGMHKFDIAKEAMRLRTDRGLERFERDGGLHSTSDFPLILASVAHKQLVQGYMDAPQTFKMWARRQDLPDLRDFNLVEMGEAPALKPVNEHGEYTYGTIKESNEKWRLGKAGRILGITSEVIINDDLGAFTQIPAAFGRSAARYQSNVFYDTFKSNPNLSDGVALFHATHNNLVGSGSGAAPSVTSLSATRLKMHKQTDLDGNPIDLVPQFLLCPPELITAVEQLLADVTPAQTSNAVPASMRGLKPIVESRLSAGTNASLVAWYLLASAQDARTMVYGGLQGRADGPAIEIERGFEIDGLKIKAGLFFGCKVEGFRGAVKNYGS